MRGEKGREKRREGERGLECVKRITTNNFTKLPTRFIRFPCRTYVEIHSTIVQGEALYTAGEEDQESFSEITISC